jgi:hypothetical protein
MRTVIGTVIGFLFGFGLFGCHGPIAKRPDRIDGRSLAPCPPKDKAEPAEPLPPNPAPVNPPAGPGN